MPKEEGLKKEEERNDNQNKNKKALSTERPNYRPIVQRTIESVPHSVHLFEDKG